MIMKNNTLSTTCVFDTAFSFLFYSTQIAYLSTLLFMLRPLPVWNRLEPSGYVRFPSGYRLVTSASRLVTSACCKSYIPTAETSARRLLFPASRRNALLGLLLLWHRDLGQAP
jgi:predicted small integral membrane protein